MAQNLTKAERAILLTALADNARALACFAGSKRGAPTVVKSGKHTFVLFT
jgi:hypothetical protein